MERVLVTGGTGFIGRHLLKGLLARGYAVRALTRRDPPPTSSPGLEWVPGRLEDPASLQAALKGCEGVFHLAGLVQARTPAEFFRVNADGTARLVEAVAQTGRPMRLIYVSSLAAVGPARDDGAVDETTPPRPISPYGESKLRGEAYVRQAPPSVAWTILRPPVVYGPGDRAVLPYFRLAARGWHVFFGPPDRRFSLVYVQDLVEGIVRVYECAQTHGKVYFIADPRPYTWTDVAETMTRLFGYERPRRLTVPTGLLWVAAVLLEAWSVLRKRPTFFDRDKLRELLQSNWVCRVENLRQDTGFCPRYTLEEGFRETIAWYIAHGWISGPRRPIQVPLAGR